MSKLKRKIKLKKLGNSEMFEMVIMKNTHKNSFRKCGKRLIVKYTKYYLLYFVISGRKLYLTHAILLTMR